MVYYIWADDYTTSKLNMSLIHAATHPQNPVKVRILVDILQNYSRHDMFEMLVREGRGNIEVKYFGRPTRNIALGAAYMTTDCGDEYLNDKDPRACANLKLPVIDSIFANEPGSLLMCLRRKEA